MIELPSEWRRQFDVARTPYDARNALGITITVDGTEVPGPPVQPLDGDLTSLSAATGTNTIYYRSATDTWTPVVMGSNMTFTAGVLNSVPGPSGISDAPADGVLYGRKNHTWVVIPPAAGGVEEAPSDGYQYGRQDTFWVKVPPEAPFTSSPYARQDGTWVSIITTLTTRIEDLERRIAALGG